nr:NTF2-like N-terminal transpeptidase domain-containing protein [Paenibacillus dendrobii]
MYGLLSFLAACVLALYVYFFGHLEEQTPNETIQSYILSLQVQDFDTIYDLMSKESIEQTGWTREQFVQKYKSIFSGMEVSEIIVKAGTPIKSAETSDYTVEYSAQIKTMTGEIYENYKLKLIQEKNDQGAIWKIEWQPTLILPDMTQGDKVKVHVIG